MLDHKFAQELKDTFGTPLFVYFEEALAQVSQDVLDWKAPFGVTPRYAMKANSNGYFLRYFSERGIYIDASSGNEALRALAMGIPGSQILLTSQELPSNEDLRALAEANVEFTACSLNQLERLGTLFPGSAVSLRFNPGEGSGAFAKVNVGGALSSFGIWHELLPEVQKLISKFNLTVDRIHTHIGSGADPEAWARVAKLSMGLLYHFPSARILNLGGGLKVARMPSEVGADLQVISKEIDGALRAFHEETGRAIHLEIEPGTYLMANAGALLSTVQDIVSTGSNGHQFIKVDTGMTEILRPSYYGAQHPMQVLNDRSGEGQEPYIVVGHCCESGDLLTTQKDNGDVPEPRLLPHAEVGDLFVVGGTGAYCSSMSTVHYNSYPQAAEVVILKDSTAKCIRRRETLDELSRLEQL